MRLKADLSLLLATVLWGSAFAVMRVATQHGSIFYLNGLRFLLAALVLLPFARLRGSFKRSNLVYYGLAGFSLYVAIGLQQAGLVTTTAGNAGFITSLYVIIVPLSMWLVYKEPPAPWMGAAVLMAVAGAFLLSTGGTLPVRSGDILILIGSFFWALHVVVVGRVQGRMDALPFAFGQFAVCALLNLLTAPFVERPASTDMLALIPAILYTGVVSIALGFTIQAFAQKHTPTNDAALIMSMESVFAVLFGWLFLRENLLPVQIAGCVLILAGVMLAQVKNGKMRTT
jgi:drug/metabolite transporter (DMT)-like permease